MLETNPEIEQARDPATAVTVSKRQPGYIRRDVPFGQLTATIEAAGQRPEFAAIGLQEGYHPPILGHNEFVLASAAIDGKMVSHWGQLLGKRFDFSLLRTANTTPPSSSVLPAGRLSSTIRSRCSPVLTPLSPQ